LAYPNPIMKITIFTLFTFCICSLSALAQNSYTIQGIASDTASKTKLLNASVSILNAKDSILRKFTRATANGSFAISDLTPGKFILLITYPDYADYVDEFTLDAAHPVHEFGAINMQLKSSLLKEVMIKGEVTAIKIKGDTTEYNAKAYVIQPNDKVEDLIRQFPGMQVDKDGNITAQGQKVGKVLVDGEEFFGDDPTLVTKNIRADMVDKVQLYDKKSDQAAFTGIDDGIKIKTLNIQLKANKKHGYFGEVNAGDATDGHYQGQGMYNNFTAKQKFSAYTTDGNTGKIGLGWQDNQKYGDASNVQVDDNGGISFGLSNSDGLDSFDGKYNGQGTPEAKTGGLHYDGKWDKDNQSLNANYKVGSLDVNGTRNSITQNNFPDSTLNTVSNQTYKNSMFRQKFDLTYVVKLDTTSTLKLAISGTYRHYKSDNNSSTITSVNNRGIDTLINSSNRSSTNAGDDHILEASAFYTKKFKKKGRTLSVLFNESINNSDSKGYLNSEIDFYKNGAVDPSQTQIINQLKTSDTKDAVFNTNITYTEPLTKYLSLIFNYGVNVNNGSSNKLSFNQSTPGIYNIIDPTVSNDFKLDQLTNQVGAILNYKKGKSLLNFGTKAADVSFKQIDEYTGDIFQRHFINWNPQANYQYKFSQQETLSVNYSGHTTQPNINQIQPVKVNTDPLNNYIGNTGLSPAFNNQVTASFYSYKVLTGQYLYLNSSYSITSNQIVNSTTTNSGVNTIQYVNLAGKSPSSFSINGSIGRKIIPIDLTIALNLSAYAYKNYAYAGNILSSSNSDVYNAGISIYKYVQKKYDFNFNFGPVYNVSESSLQTAVNNNSKGFSANGRINIYLPAKFLISSDANYTYTGKTETFDSDLSKTILNASLNKTFFKADNLKISLSGNDLLNQNVGFYRSTNANVISQSDYTTIKRYFMFSVTWDFNKMGGEPAKK
jgi:hypothetical protein